LHRRLNVYSQHDPTNVVIARTARDSLALVLPVCAIANDGPLK
jgi:hypothetical protein